MNNSSLDKSTVIQTLVSETNETTSFIYSMDYMINYTGQFWFKQEYNSFH